MGISDDLRSLLVRWFRRSKFSSFVKTVYEANLACRMELDSKKDPRLVSSVCCLNERSLTVHNQFDCSGI